MKLGIMQPYFFPYIGYFQLISAIDTFVIYDDVNYFKSGWINRNYILSQGHKSRITLQLHGASQNEIIKNIVVGQNRGKLVKTIEHSYAKAPQYSSVYPILKKIILFNENNLALYLENSLKEISRFIGLQPNWLRSSELHKDNTLRGQDKIIAICKILGAHDYINSISGKELYSKDRFSHDGIRLSFIKPDIAKYDQMKNQFIPNLSIIDVLMFNPVNTIHTYLKEYSLA